MMPILVLRFDTWALRGLALNFLTVRIAVPERMPIADTVQLGANVKIYHPDQVNLLRLRHWR